MYEKDEIGDYGMMYPEVIVTLERVSSYAARWVYLCMICDFPVYEIWDTDRVWVAGIVVASKRKIAEVAEVNRGNITALLNSLIEPGLVVNMKDGSFMIPRYMKKEDAHISEREITERLTRIERRNQVTNHK